jgi:hypothetical protein
MTNTPLETLEQGSKLLEPLLFSRGFTFSVIGTGAGSGGHFAVAEFKRGDRQLEFHFRVSLGLVTYKLGEASMDHLAYMRSVLGRYYASHYPGFSSEPLDGFRHMLLDLAEHCGDFLDGTDDALRNRIEDALTHRYERQNLPD